MANNNEEKANMTAPDMINTTSTCHHRSNDSAVFADRRILHKSLRFQLFLCLLIALFQLGAFSNDPMLLFAPTNCQSTSAGLGLPDVFHNRYF
jgi:hypothetical protein